MTAIRGLKQEIGRLKNTMESLGYGEEPIMHPNEDTHLHWTCEYLERAKQAYSLYRKFGFEIEGVLKNDKILSDGRFYNTVVMGRFNA